MTQAECEKRKTTDANEKAESFSVNKIWKQLRGAIVLSLTKLKDFEVDNAVSKWWANQQVAAKVSFLSALIIGFVSHLFVYTGRYYGRDDSGTISRTQIILTPTGIGPIKSGRWFNGLAIGPVTYHYVLPLVYGVLVAVFLAAAAFYVCKIFKIEKKVNGVLIGLLLSTYPSIANTNLFLYETATYHFAVLLAVLAVYVTIKYRHGYIVGAILVMLTLATYQAKFNIVLALCLFYLICKLLEGLTIKEIWPTICKLALLVGLGVALYIASLAISLSLTNLTLDGYRGLSVGSMMNRLLSFHGLRYALESTYKSYFKGFVGNIHLVVDGLKYAYVLAMLFAAIFLITIVVQKKIYKKIAPSMLIVIFFALIPLAGNFTALFDAERTYGAMTYSFVFLLVFFVVLSEQCKCVFPLFKSIFVFFMFFIIGNHITSNNIYYMQAYYSNQRTYSLTIRVLDRIEPLLPLTSSNTVVVYGGLPNEYLQEGVGFGVYGDRMDGSSLRNTTFLNYDMGFDTSNSVFLYNAHINFNHGIDLVMLADVWPPVRNDEYHGIKKEVLDTNMPAWPAEGSVAVINDVVVVNFGLADVVFEEDENGQFFRVRHWISDGHAEHKYEYLWKVHRNGAAEDSLVTTSSRLYLDPQNASDSYQVSAWVRNTTIGYSYPEATITVIP